jgi:transcriptional regulator with XRE-family HTH domain
MSVLGPDVASSACESTKFLSFQRGFLFFGIVGYTARRLRNARARGSPLSVRYDDIGDRLKAFRLGSGLSAEEIAQRAGISRTALYRFEKGELVKIETLEKLADLLNVSVTTLLGVGIEYIPSAVSYFERLRQIEETAEHLTVLAGPISFLLASDTFMTTLASTLRESIPDDLDDRAKMLGDVSRIIDILRQRKEMYRYRQPSIVNLMSGLEIARFVRDGMVGSYSLPEEVRRERRALARAEVEHFAAAIEAEDMGVQIGIVSETLPQFGFQILRQPDREMLVLSPFRLGEHPNVMLGVAMITSAPEALTLHRRVVNEMWRRSLKGPAAAQFLRQLLETTQKDAPLRTPLPKRRLSVVRGKKAV